MKKSERTLTPSQRKSITEFSHTYGSEQLDEKQKVRSVFTVVSTIAALILLLYLGYFICDVLIGITEVAV